MGRRPVEHGGALCALCVFGAYLYYNNTVAYIYMM